MHPNFNELHGIYTSIKRSWMVEGFFDNFFNVILDPYVVKGSYK